MSERTINTVYNPKPIPVRGFDWSATFADYEPGDPIGHGATEEAAKQDLLAEDTFLREVTP